MRHPPYQLRPNKAVDRLFMIEAIRRLAFLADLRDFTYYGLGGPYLDDFRLIYEHFPEIALVSIERDRHTFLRQRFHRPCGTIRLEHGDLRSFLAEHAPFDGRSIFWLDYTGLDYGLFEDFMTVLAAVPAASMIKLTLRCQPQDYSDAPGQSVGTKADSFRRRFGEIMPDVTADPPRSLAGFAYLLQEMVQIAAQRALPSALGFRFQPVLSFYYSDGTGIFTLTGVVCRRGGLKSAKDAFGDMPFSNLYWARPRRIDVPVLSTKERLQLERFLPCERYAGRTLRMALGYLVDRDRSLTETKLKNYAEFHRYYPYFMKAEP